MKKKRSLSFLSAIGMLVLLASCSKDGLAVTLSGSEGADMIVNEKVRQYLSMANNVLPSEQLITETYHAEQIASSFGGYFYDPIHSYRDRIETVEEECKIECVRDMGDGKFYVVFQVAEGGRWYSFFDKEYLSHNIYVKEPLDAAAFRKLKIGDTLGDVQKLDPALALSKADGTPLHCNELPLGYSDQDMDAADNMYTVHLFYNQLVMITYTENQANREASVITKIDILPDFTIVYRNFTSEVDGHRDFRILPQDYPLGN